MTLFCLLNLLLRQLRKINKLIICMEMNEWTAFILLFPLKNIWHWRIYLCQCTPLTAFFFGQCTLHQLFSYTIWFSKLHFLWFNLNIIMKYPHNSLFCFSEATNGSVLHLKLSKQINVANNFNFGFFIHTQITHAFGHNICAFYILFNKLTLHK